MSRKRSASMIIGISICLETCLILGQGARRWDPPLRTNDHRDRQACKWGPHLHSQQGRNWVLPWQLVDPHECGAHWFSTHKVRTWIQKCVVNNATPEASRGQKETRNIDTKFLILVFLALAFELVGVWFWALASKMEWPLIAQGNLCLGGSVPICGKSLNVQKNSEFLSTTWTTWSTLRTRARTPQSTLTCTMRSPEHAAHRLLVHMCSHIALVAQGVLFLEWSLLTRLSTSSSSSSSSSTWCPSWRLMRSPLKIPCATPAWGAWSLWTVSQPSQVMSPRRWSSQTPMSWTSRPPAISATRTPWTTWFPSPTFLTSTTTSLRSVLQLWSIAQGNLLRCEIIMINFPVTSETWKVLRVSSFGHSTQKNDQSNWGVCSRKDRWGAWKL